MLMSIYKKAFGVMMKKPLRLWGISLLYVLLTNLSKVLFISIPVIGIAVNYALSVSMAVIFLLGYRGKEAKSADLFYCFTKWDILKRTVGGMGWRTLWIFLWALIPFAGPVFAIIRALEYSLTPYILAMEGNVPPTEAINVSKRRTRGHRGKIFLALILPVAAVFTVVLTLTLISYIFSLIPYIGIVFSVLFSIVISVIVLCAEILLPLFYGLVMAAFYEEITKSERINVQRHPEQNI